MPNVFGIPLIGFIQMVLGTGIIVFLLIKFPFRWFSEPELSFFC